MLLFYFIYFLVSIRSDPCSLLDGKFVVEADVALACYDQFKFNNESRSQLLSTLRRSLDFTPSYQASQVADSLNKIEHQVFQTERAFHTALTKEYLKLKTEKFHYASKCFTTFMFQQPISVMSYAEDGVNYYIAYLNPSVIPEATHIWSKTHDLNRLHNAEIVAIENQDPEKYLAEFGDDNIAISWDSNANFNMALAGSVYKNKTYEVRPGLFSQSYIPPNKTKITFDLILETGERENVTLPYVAYSPGIHNTNQFITDFCTDHSNNNQSKRHGLIDNQLKRRGLTDITHSKRLERLSKGSIRTKPQSRRKRQIDEIDEESKNWFHSGIVSRGVRVNATTGSLILSSFELDDPEWWHEIDANFDHFQSNGITTLIIDLSYNFGGKNRLAYLLAQRLIGTIPEVNMNMAKSDIINQFKRSNTTTYFSDSNYDLKPTSSGTHYYQERRPTMQTTSHYRPNRIILLSNSICFGACALFAHLLKDHPTVTTHTIGTLSHSTANIGSLVGGFSRTLSLIRSDIRAAHIDNYDLPVPTRVEHHLPILTVVTDDGTQLDSIPQSANHHIPYSYDNFVNITYVYNQLAVTSVSKGSI